jgi:ribonuclease Z
MEISEQTKITVFGTDSAIPDVGSETASFMINDDIVIDTGWSIVSNLRHHNVEPTQIKYLFFTHMHHDHYLSLPSLLYYFLMAKKDLSELKIIGPEEDVVQVVEQAMEFLLLSGKFYADRSGPTVIPIKPGASFETETFEIHTCPSVHTVQSMAYRFINKATKRSFTYSGDTCYHPPIAQLSKGCSLLIHEATLGPVAAEPDNPGRHCGSVDAANIAKIAGVDRLMMVHGSMQQAEACIEAARQTFSGQVEWPQIGQTITL